MLNRSSLTRLAAALALALPVAATAQDATELDEVVVTGTRTEVPLAESLVPAQVIDRDEIERSQARDLVQLLRGRAGIDIVNQGGRGKLSSLFLRGAESDHVLVLVDGVKIGSATSGMVAFQDLPLAQVERIEIIRGPRSSLYGSEAIGGVIQVFTRGGTGKGLAPYASLGGGSHGTRDLSAGFDYRGARGWIGAGGAYSETDGINACRGTAGSAEFPWGAGCYADEPDDDGYRNVSLNLRGGLRLTEALTLEGNLLDAQGENEYDGSWTNRSRTLQQVAGAQLRYAPAGGRVALAAAAGRSKDRSDDYQGDTFMSRFHTRRDSVSLQGDVTLAAGHLLSLGIDHASDRVDSTTGYTADERDNTGVFVGYDGRAGAHRFQASVRNDDNEQFGHHLTGSLGWGLSFGNGLRVSASAGTGFKAPSFNDLYYPGYSNPLLEPEESRSLNLGVAQSAGGWHWGLDVYETRVDNLIALDANWIPANIDKARIRGAELGVGATVAGFDLSAQLSHVDPRDRSGGFNDGNVLARRARNSGRIDLDRAFGPVRLGVTVQGAGGRYDDAANGTRLGGYATTDLRLEYAFGHDWSLLARASNVFDREYETVSWYHQPGREYQLALRWRPSAR